MKKTRHGRGRALFRGGTMEEKYVRIARFLESCTSLMQCDYRMAGGKIREILRGIAASGELTALFTAVTKGFDYTAARRIYLRPASGGTHGTAYLPVARKDILAFVFCLLVEFDAGTMKLEEFLLRYFYVDGSYTAGFLIFTDRVVKPFRDIVADCFPEIRAGEHGEERGEREHEEGRQEAFAPAAALIEAERGRIAALDLGEEGRAASELIFAGLSQAAAEGDVALFSAVLAGYKYFLRYFGIGEQPALFSFAASL